MPHAATLENQVPLYRPDWSVTLGGPSAENSAELPGNYNALIHTSLKGPLFFSPIPLIKELFGGNNRLEDFVTWETFEKN